MSEVTKPIKIDFNDKSLKVPKGKVSKLDPTEDSFSFAAPPPDGEYDLTLTLSQRGIEARPIDEKQELSEDNVYFLANMECLITNNEDWNNTRVFPVVSSRVGRNKNLSTMADLIIRIVGPSVIKPEMSEFEVAELFNKLMAKTPLMKKVPLQWEGYSSEDKKTIFKGMKEFPEDGKGGYKHQVEYRASNKREETINAQLRVVKWPLGKKPVEDGAGEKKGSAAPKKLAKLPAKPVETVVEPETDDSELFGDLGGNE